MIKVALFDAKAYDRPSFEHYCFSSSSSSRIRAYTS